jgi:AcrR family transcriptional regulator
VSTAPHAGRTARERARAELTREIKEEARRQLSVSGADGLSLRAVARSLGMVSSALYRYFPSRDNLLTALIIDAYNAVGAAAEAAAGAAAEAAAGGPAGGPAGGAAGGAASGDACGRWAAACRAVRGWALANPHEYALIYGSPVPGYQAPADTVGPAARVPLAFLSVLRDAAEHGVLDAGGASGGAGGAGGAAGGAGGAGAEVGGRLAEQAAVLAEATGAALPPGVLVRAVIAWTQLFGMISFELFGQLVGSFEPADDLFEHAIALMLGLVGLTGTGGPGG